MILTDVEKHLKRKYEELMQEPKHENHLLRKISQFWKETLNIQKIQIAGLINKNFRVKDQHYTIDK